MRGCLAPPGERRALLDHESQHIAATGRANGDGEFLRELPIVICAAATGPGRSERDLRSFGCMN